MAKKKRYLAFFTFLGAFVLFLASCQCDNEGTACSPQPKNTVESSSELTKQSTVNTVADTTEKRSTWTTSWNDVKRSTNDDHAAKASR